MKYMKSHHTHFSDRREETTSEQSLPVQKFNTDFILFLLLTYKLLLPFMILLTWVCTDKQVDR